MTTCAHEDLHLEDGTEYSCATCGQGFVMLRLEERREPEPLDETPPASGEVDVSGQIGLYLDPQRRLPAKRSPRT